MSKSKHSSPTLNSFLDEEGIREELKAIVTKEAIAFQLEKAMKKKRITEVKLAELMDSCCTQVDHILDPKSGSVTIETLLRVAKIVGKELRVELVQCNLYTELQVRIICSAGLPVFQNQSPPKERISL